MKDVFKDNILNYQAGRGKLEKIVDLRGVQNALTQLAIGSFLWDGLPDGLTSKMLESYLFTCGTVAAFEDKNAGGFMMLPAVGIAQMNVYGLPQKYTVTGVNYTRMLDVDDVVLLHNNTTHTGSFDTVANYAEAINEINVTDRLNIKQLRFPWMFSGSEETINSLKAAIVAAQNNQFALFTTPGVQAAIKEGIGFSTGVQYLGDDLKNHRDDLYNECLTLLGFDNAPIRKKERVSSAETESNDMQINFFRKDRLARRTEAAAQINAKFGTNISVKWVGGGIDERT